MSIKTSVVIHNATTKKHEPLATGDKLAGSVIQLSSDAGNSITTGTDGGLLVAAVVALPDDQVLTGDNSGSVALTLTPQVQPNGDTNYSIKGDVKLSPAPGNVAKLTSGELYVAKTTFTAGVAPTTTDDNSTPTTFFGGNTSALGTPEGFFEVEIDGQQKLVPYYSLAYTPPLIP